MNAPQAIAAGPPRRRAQRGGVILKTIFLVAAVAALAALFLFRAPLLRAAGGWLVVDELLQPSDAIVVLGDDTFEAVRAAHAAALYADRWAPRVVASGRFLRPGVSLAELIGRDLAERGVPREAVVVLSSRGGNTREEALEVRRLVRRHRWRRIIVVTSNYHTRRTRFIYRRVLDPDTELRLAAAPDPAFDPQRWWQQRTGRKAAFNEAVGLAVAWWETRGPQTLPEEEGFAPR